jgi:hypothetical protein
VDNFCAKKIFNDFNVQGQESRKSVFFIDFSDGTCTLSVPEIRGVQNSPTSVFSRLQHPSPQGREDRVLYGGFSTAVPGLALAAGA